MLTNVTKTAYQDQYYIGHSMHKYVLEIFFS